MNARAQKLLREIAALERERDRELERARTTEPARQYAIEVRYRSLIADLLEQSEIED